MLLVLLALRLVSAWADTFGSRCPVTPSCPSNFDSPTEISLRRRSLLTQRRRSGNGKVCAWQCTCNQCYNCKESGGTAGTEDDDVAVNVLFRFEASGGSSSELQNFSRITPSSEKRWDLRHTAAATMM